MSKSNHPIRRRQFIATSASAALSAALAPEAAAAASTAARSPKLIENENRREGARDWQLTRVRVDPVKGLTQREAYRSSAIEGYCSRQSVAAGETIEFMVSTNPPSRYTLEIFRSGYYGGRGARLM